tara:strand:- start:633 stop:953 length:321 start_codon:yes stop_codon:yes gene_type:complete
MKGQKYLIFKNTCNAVIILALISCGKTNRDYTQLVSEFGLDEVTTTFDEAKVKQMLGDDHRENSLKFKQAAALLATLGLNGSTHDNLSQWNAHPFRQKANSRKQSK